MKIAVGADHKGFQLKRDIRGFLESQGHEVIDFGTDSDASVDYPDYGEKAALAVAQGQADLGILFCWTGTGMAITANKLPGIRSAVALTTDMAQLARQHNDVNVLSIPSKYVEPEQAKAIVQSWLLARFEGGRHARRLAKIESMEEAHDTGSSPRRS